MERDSAAEYFFSLLDDAASVILSDPLRQTVPVYSYRIEDEEEVRIDPSVSAIFTQPSSRQEEQGGPRSVQSGALGVLQLSEMLMDCHECEAWLQRNGNTVAGQGASKPIFLFVVDRIAPDGSFFSMQEMAFFDKWLKGLHLDARRECHYTSVIKCPTSTDFIFKGCEDILARQIEVLDPRVVVMLGSAGCFITTGDGDIFKARGRVHTYHGCPTVCSFSPTQVLADYAALRRPVWEDLKLAAKVAGTLVRI